MSQHKGPLRLSLERWWGSIDIAGNLKKITGDVFAAPKKFVVRLATPILMDVRDTPGLPPHYKALIDEVTGTEPVTLTLVAGMVLMAAIGGMISGIMQPIQRVIAQWVDSGIESARASPSTAYPMMWRTPEHKAELVKHVRQGGWNETILEGFEELLRPHLGLTELFTLWRRGTITDKHLFDALRKYGWADSDIIKLEKLQWIIPGPNDLISMAVREAFSPEIVAKFGYGEDFPAEFAYWAEKQGLTEEWARRYWTAHWKLPSTQAGYEMLHRGVIDEDTLRLLLKTADIPAFWRDKLMAISYANFTRVDIRRMYQTGVLSTAEEVITAYMDIGYNVDKAIKLTEFTLKEYGEETREASKADVLAAYELGRLSKTESLDLLKTIEYPEWIAQSYLARIDLKRANRLASDLIRSVKVLYTGGQITRTDVITQLSTIPLPAPEMDRYIEEWDISRRSKTKRPSRSDLRKMFLSNILEEDDFRRELSGHGLTGTYVSWYVDQAKYDLAELARKENEGAMKEAERLLKADFKTDLDVELAGFDVLIAQANVAIADIKLSMVEGMEVAEVDEAKRIILEYKLFIADFRRDKADLRKAYLIEKQKGD